MPSIVLTAINARYSHVSFGSLYLMANLGELREDALFIERDLKSDPEQVLQDIASHRPRIAAFGVYIWNREILENLLPKLRAALPAVCIILGGPELTAPQEDDPLVLVADAVLCGEADLRFAELCRNVLNGLPPTEKIQFAEPPDPAELALPYDLYSDRDIANRVVYVEASRGCPFTCDFCLSAKDKHLNRFPLDRLLPELDRLIQRGVREFKFVDRTFNLNLDYTTTLLDFFLNHPTPGLFVHTEMVPDRLPDGLKNLLRQFPDGSLQLEVGVQTWNPEVARRIHRIQDYDRTENNLRWLLSETGAHLHVDLIVGLPGETLESFAQGLDRLVDIRPHEIQINLLKHLRGTPLTQHIEPWCMEFNHRPPYEIRRNQQMNQEVIAEMTRFARYWDLVVNSGNFIRTSSRLLAARPSAFEAFRAWTRWLYQRLNRTHAIPLDRLATELFTWLTEAAGQTPSDVAEALYADYGQAGHPDLPPVLRPHVANYQRRRPEASGNRRLKRQHRHHH